jgi:hypothetical protein
MAKQSKQTYQVTDKRGARTVQMTERQAILTESNGATVRTTRTPAQKRTARQWDARGIGGN